ncbi:polysaccharide biosynthesis protein [Aquimarina sp. AD10]|uniref:oligosaccharide flippase family protein n=1 Tax=Aquimarina sp. AD10 TaxID=1714849 RepID=UPI000E526479|nr:oligosaccharide flippase family protein [Aquimarina sp. AD10]AXT61789.1 polysaccharide biosynthesis protein [Aquimarina sp. AD10]RKN02587.1 polysaccharide biosynthesis protein [Aquimarina sp. AD10]
MSIFQKLFKQTFIYGLATVLPRVLGIVLVPLYVDVLNKNEYGVYASIMALLITGNILFSYGMETAFFRFVSKDPKTKNSVQSTALTSLTSTTILLLGIGILCRNELATFLEFETQYIVFGLLILSLDALVVLPFAWFRINERPMRYAVIKIFNVIINLGFNLFFFLILPRLAIGNDTFWDSIYFENDKVIYVFIANLIASAVTLLLLLPIYAKIRFGFTSVIWKSMIKYAFPVLIAGIAFSINEAFDKLLLKYLLPENIADGEVGVYAACYKLGVFMTLYSTAFRLGIEPFFFNHANSKNAKETYAKITLYFSILGSCILLGVVVFSDFLKQLIIPDSTFWEAMIIVPIILLANLCLGIYHNLSVWYKITDKTKFGAYISVTGAIITLTLNFLLIPKYTYVGSAIATLSAYGTMMILSWYFGRKYYPIPYNLKKIGMYLVTSISFSILSFYVFDSNYMVSIPLLLVFLVILYAFEGKELKQILKK